VGIKRGNRSLIINLYSLQALVAQTETFTDKQAPYVLILHLGLPCSAPPVVPQKWATCTTQCVSKSKLGLGDRSSRVRFPTTAFRPAVGPIKPRIQWVRGALSLGVKWWGVKLTTHLHLVPRPRMRGAIPPLTQYVLMVWCLVKHRDNFTFHYISISHSHYAYTQRKTNFVIARFQVFTAINGHDPLVSLDRITQQKTMT
jgi:hypothetical protein